MGCDSSYMEPNGREISSLARNTDGLKAAIDELVHFCDGSRDTLEAAFEGHTIQLPDVKKGYQLVENIKEQTRKVKNNYAYRNSGGKMHSDADALIDIADQVFAQLDRIMDVIKVWQRGEKASDELVLQLRQDQIQHRMGDMMRVYKHFANKDSLTTEEVAVLSSIDLTQPLIPQLGFDPDDV
jgi:hypothetical protein